MPSSCGASGEDVNTLGPAPCDKNSTGMGSVTLGSESSSASSSPTSKASAPIVEISLAAMVAIGAARFDPEGDFLRYYDSMCAHNC